MIAHNADRRSYRHGRYARHFGSAKIGRHCMLAAAWPGRPYEICDNVFVTGMTMVTCSITEPGSYSSGTAMQPAAEWKAPRIRQLDDMARRLQQLENAWLRDLSGTLHLMRNDVFCVTFLNRLPNEWTSTIREYRLIAILSCWWIGWSWTSRSAFAPTRTSVSMSRSSTDISSTRSCRAC